VSGSKDNYDARLAEMRRELTSLRARYLDDHPEVKAKEREIKALIASGPNAAPAGDQTQNDAPVVPTTQLERDIQAQKREIARYQGEQTRIRSDIALYTARLEAAPQVQLQLDEVSKGYDALQQQYRDYQTKAQSAKGAETIEDAQKGEQFEVIERAVPPVLPVAPNAIVILAVCVGMGLLLFAGPQLVLGLLRPTVQSEEGLRAFINVPVLVSIPRIKTEAASREAVQVRFRNIGLAAMSATILAIVVLVEHFR
jgi:uncharacterized protein involved in exopolysaccharide biosynthesis